LYNGKERLANAYYHWSAYSLPSITLTEVVIKKLEEIGDALPPKLKAIKALEATGAGMVKTELEEAKALFPNVEFKPCVDRNEGLLGITQDYMDTTFDWNEGFIKIDIKSETFCFDVCWSEAQPLIYSSELDNMVEAEQIETNINLDEVNFCEIETLYSLFEEIGYGSDKVGKVTTNNDEFVFVRAID
jgi:hypothetical protein